MSTGAREYYDMMTHRFDIDYSLTDEELPAVGERFDYGTTAVEYMGECYFDYTPPMSDDDDFIWSIVGSADDRNYGTLDDFMRTTDAPNFTNWFDGISHDTINSGYLLKMTPDQEGCHIFRHWGK